MAMWRQLYKWAYGYTYDSVIIIRKFGKISLVIHQWGEFSAIYVYWIKQWLHSFHVGILYGSRYPAQLIYDDIYLYMDMKFHIAYSDIIRIWSIWLSILAAYTIFRNVKLQEKFGSQKIYGSYMLTLKFDIET